MKLDHATIVTGDLEAARQFLCSVVGLSEGPRPPFGVKGHWLYAEGEPVIHLIGRTPIQPSQPSSTRIDHIGLRISSAQEWAALLERVQRCGIPHEVSEVPLTGERQLFLTMAPGVTVELVTDQQAQKP